MVAVGMLSLRLEVMRGMPVSIHTYEITIAEALGINQHAPQSWRSAANNSNP